mgnify:CR=1 FL=1
MKSVVINSYGSSDVIRIIEQDEKSCDSDLVKIKVHSCSLNHLDKWVRIGSTPYKHIFPFVLGSDASGEVVEIGDNVTKFASVRFGNVLDSNGSVIRVFKQQLKEKKPLTITFP